MISFRAAALLVLLAFPGLAAGTPGELGLPFLQNFTPRDYAAGTQNWAFQDDGRGVLYVGNNAGVLEYDGTTWRLLPTRNKSCVRSLGQDASGRIFLGAKNEFGCLAPDARGQMQYVPLEDLVEPAARNFADVWAVLPAADGVYFTTRDWLFRYDGRTVRSWKAETSFTLGWKVHGRIYLYERGVGPVRLGPGGLERLAGGDAFAKELVNFMVPWGGGDSILMGTSHQGLVLWDGAGFQPFPTEVDAYLRKCVLTSGLVLRDGSLAVGGLSGGCFILDRQGRLLMHLDRKGGLQEETVNRLYCDAHARLWLGLNRGLARVEWPSPFSAFGEDSGLEGTVNVLVRHQGRLYAGTSKGVFVLNHQHLDQQHLDLTGAGEDGPNLSFGPLGQFRKLPGVDTRVGTLLSMGGQLLAGNTKGLYEVGKDRLKLLLPTGADRDVLCLVPSRMDPARLYLGLQTGLGMARWTGTRWQDEGRVAGVKGEVRTLAEMEDGSLWLGTQASGVFHVSRPGTQDEDVQAYGTAQGLPSLAHDFVKPFSTGLLFTTHKGFYRFEARTQRFEPDPRFVGLLAPGPWYADGVTEGQDGRIWMHVLNEATSERRTGAATAGPGGLFRFDGGPWARVADFNTYAILPEPDGKVWLGGPEGLMRYDPALEWPQPWTAPPLIRRITGTGSQQLFGGAGAWAWASTKASAGAGRIPYASNTLRFEFAAPGGAPEAATRYQVRLEGYDKDWSAWTAETFRDYTNLPEGRYRFLVRARNGAGQVSPEGAAFFRILPPFYRTWWAWLGYAAGLAMLGHYLVKWRLFRSHQARRALVRRIMERTEQLRRRTRELEQAKTAAEAATRAKSEFLANMSHEIRTPLNTILGYAEILRDEVAEPRHRDHLTAISSGGKALLGIIGDILDLSKIEAGRVDLHCVPTNLADLVEDVVRTFTLRCREKGLDLRIELDPALPRTLLVSQVHLRQILFNLVGNAVKFTERGAVRVALKERARTGALVDLTLEVEDSGVGIHESNLGTIFEAFHQVAGQDAVRYGGTGLGLTICRRLAGAMGGTLTVVSTEGLGSTFTLLLRGVPGTQGEAPVLEPERAFHGDFLPCTVLLVDDASANRNLVKHYFEATPLLFLEAGDGATALAMAREHRPGLIVMDLRMPVLDGLQATRILKADEQLKAIPVLILTASTAPDEEGPVRACGAEGFLRKPVSRARLALEFARFLPYRPGPGPAPLVPGPAPELAPEVRAALPELLALLEGDPLVEWAKLKDAFFLDRMTALASRVGALADRFQEPHLKAWSNQVLAQAASFDMENLPRTFKALPEVLARVRQLTEDPVQ